MPRVSAKLRRQQAIVDVVRDAVIRNQDELRFALADHGFEVAQSTLSRDLKELRIPCVPTADGYRYRASGNGHDGGIAEPAVRGLGSVAAAEVLAVDANQVSVVVRTLAGRAQGVGVYIDGLHHDDILGSVAGDDTVLVLPRSIRRTTRLCRDLKRRFGLD